jgi:hypothetical protein
VAHQAPRPEDRSRSPVVPCPADRTPPALCLRASCASPRSHALRSHALRSHALRSHALRSHALRSHASRSHAVAASAPPAAALLAPVSGRTPHLSCTVRLECPLHHILPLPPEVDPHHTSTVGHIDHGPALTFPVRRASWRVFCPVMANVSRDMWAGGACVTGGDGAGRSRRLTGPGHRPITAARWPGRGAGHGRGGEPEGRPGRETCHLKTQSPGGLGAAPTAVRRVRKVGNGAMGVTMCHLRN